MRRALLILLGGLLATPSIATPQPPELLYIFPAGGQRGTVIPTHAGGVNFHGKARFEILGAGVQSDAIATETKTIWFEGPLIPQPDSQAGESYPRDHANRITIAKDAPLGPRLVRCSTSQGATQSLPFIVGDLPEIIESEADGRPIPRAVILPVTINGRIFPRENVDAWTLDAKTGETIVCEVATRQFGSPLEAVLTVLGPDGQPVRLQHSLRRGDPRAWFVALTSGTHTVRITDASHGGLQHYIYRLTLKRSPHAESIFPIGGRRGQTINTTIQGPSLPARQLAVTLAAATGDAHWADLKDGAQTFGTALFHVDDLPEVLEAATPAAPQSLPVMLNGRIAKLGELDEWTLQLAEKESLTLDLFAARLGSPLDGVVRILDDAGKTIATNDDRASGQPDSLLTFAAPKAGAYRVQVSDRFASRGGPAFAYRLRATGKPAPDFRLTVATDAITILRDTVKVDANGKPIPTPNPKLRVAVDRVGGFAGPVRLSLSGLPAEINATQLIIPPNLSSIDVQFSAPPKTPIAVHRFTIRGEGLLVDKNATRQATTTPLLGQVGSDHVTLAVALPTPFKFLGQFQLANSQPTGTTVQRPYQIDTGGVPGPFTVRLADKQGRHVQGVIGPVMVLPPGTTTFDYPITYPSRMEIGRTSRIQIMMTGEVTDFDGSKHTVCYSSFDGENQIMAITSDIFVTVALPAQSYSVHPNSLLTLPVRVRRDQALLSRPMKVEVIMPAHMRGVTALPLLLAPGAEKGELRLQFGSEIGPFNMPVSIRASTASGVLFFGESQIDLVALPGK